MNGPEIDNLLGDRAREVLVMTGEGWESKEIAGLLRVSKKTVDYHKSVIADTLNIHAKGVPCVGALYWAYRCGHGDKSLTVWLSD